LREVGKITTTEMKTNLKRARETRKLTVLKGLAIISLVLIAVSPPLTTTISQNIRQATTIPTSAITSEEQKPEISKAPSAPSPTLKWNYTGKAGAYLDFAADLFGNGKTEIIVDSGGSVCCLNGMTGKEIWNCTGGWSWRGGVESYYSLSASAVGDLFGNGKQEVLVLSNNGSLICLDGTTGKEIWRYAVPGTTLYPGGLWLSPLEYSPIIADLFGNGKQDVIVNSNGSVYCLNGRTGGLLWSSGKGGMWSPVVADLLGNGKEEILTASAWSYSAPGSHGWGADLYCLDGATGSSLWDFSIGGPLVIPYPYFGSPVAADLFGDGKQEVIVEALEKSSGSNTYCLDGATGRLLWGYATGAWNEFSPVVADLFGNRELEVLVVSGGRVYCLDGRTGKAIWSFGTDGDIYYSPVAADLLDIGEQEVIVGTSNSTYCLEGETGSKLWNYTTRDPWDFPYYSTPPIAADLYRTGLKQLIIGWSNSIYCLDGRTGSCLWNYTIPRPSMTHYIPWTGPILADVDADGRQELIIGVLLGSSFLFMGAVYCLSVPSLPSSEFASQLAIGLAILFSIEAAIGIMVIVVVKNRRQKKGSK
jgi:outer membrane protein assembly factor BamB